MWHLLWISILCLLAGCSSSKQGVIPETGLTMAEIYQTHLSGGRIDPVREEVAPIMVASEPMAKPVTVAQLDGTNEPQPACRFPKLPNPSVRMYVYPHLAGANLAPIPGYYTEFNLYETNYYAMPGELGKC